MKCPELHSQGFRDFPGYFILFSPIDPRAGSAVSRIAVSCLHDVCSFLFPAMHIDQETGKMPIFELEMDDVEAALHVLHSELWMDLEQLEARIHAAAPATNAITPVSAEADSTMSEWHAARTALHSGLESIAEVLGWIRVKTDEEPEGSVALALQPLPSLRGWSIH